MQSDRSLRTLARKIGFDPDYLEAFENKLFISGPQTARRLTNFFVLLLLASVIATYGLISDSTASVIGAMIVAPLMGPIMATAAAVVMGSAERALRSLALVAVGVVSVNDRTVVVTVDGSGELRPLKQLATALATTLGRPLQVNLRIVPSQLESSE
jgi:hypothetical protein